ncbi:unnamed protein product [Coffea canephora]|uniref:Uncharacterized protein n=1 Tax=Coffea canephora TaxID=49390 RepID=A0A068UB61_COFCA|nr:unnamed protein product [Coffea canephora]
MCIAVFIWEVHPLSIPPASQSGRISQSPNHPSGLDGRLAFLTNVRELVHPSSPHQQPKSRGYLPLRFLQSKKSPEEFADELLEEATLYNGFNLIVADLCSMSMLYITNRPKGSGIIATQVSPGIHVLSNAKLDSPWPKVVCSKIGQSFKDLMDKYGEGEIPLKEMSEKLMNDTTKDDESKLPQIYPPEWEYHSSSIFVDADMPMGRYGTRSTSALAMSTSGNITYFEKHLDADLWKEQIISFQIRREEMTLSSFKIV